MTVWLLEAAIPAPAPVEGGITMIGTFGRGEFPGDVGAMELEVDEILGLEVELAIVLDIFVDEEEEKQYPYFGLQPAPQYAGVEPQ